MTAFFLPPSNKSYPKCTQRFRSCERETAHGLGSCSGRMPQHRECTAAWLGGRPRTLVPPSRELPQAPGKTPEPARDSRLLLPPTCCQISLVVRAQPAEPP